MTGDLVVRALVVVLALAATPKWLRVAQREHYLPTRASWTWLLWTSRSFKSVVVTAYALAAYAEGLFVLPFVLVGVVLAAATPVGLGFRGRTSTLAWTPRVKRLAAVVAVLLVLVALVSAELVGLAAVLLPAVVDVALAVTAPLERRLSAKYLVQARAMLARVRPTVVAITGSYGKTTTKSYLAHLLAGAHTVLASPASFNNAMGLSRAVNEGLVPGTEVFVAEMGTYGRGEIRALCEAFPDVAVLTAIGEAHLERMKSREGVLVAKSEITEKARAVVLNVDDDLLVGLADRCAAAGQEVVRCSTRDTTADVALVDRTALWVRGTQVATVELPDAVHPSNVACALGAALALGDDPALLAPRLASLPTVAHRLEPVQQAGGSWILDDTYNSNPDGAREAVRRALALAGRSGGKAHVVTPGMVELGSVQAERNEELARTIALGGVSTLVVVGRTNAAALRRGAVAPSETGWQTEVLAAPDRAAAVALVETRARPGDVVLFENDLPDHYP